MRLYENDTPGLGIETSYARQDECENQFGHIYHIPMYREYMGKTFYGNDCGERLIRTKWLVCGWWLFVLLNLERS